MVVILYTNNLNNNLPMYNKYLYVSTQVALICATLRLRTCSEYTKVKISKDVHNLGLQARAVYTHIYTETMCLADLIMAGVYNTS